MGHDPRDPRLHGRGVCLSRSLRRDQALGAEVFGLSTQAPEDLREAADRLRLPFELLSDADRQFTRALSLPTFRIGQAVFIKRLTLLVWRGRIEKVFYPVFLPHAHPDDVLA